MKSCHIPNWITCDVFLSCSTVSECWRLICVLYLFLCLLLRWELVILLHPRNLSMSIWLSWAGRGGERGDQINWEEKKKFVGLLLLFMCVWKKSRESQHSLCLSFCSRKTAYEYFHTLFTWHDSPDCCLPVLHYVSSPYKVPHRCLLLITSSLDPPTRHPEPCSPDEYPERQRTAWTRLDHGWSISTTSLPIRLWTVVSTSWPVHVMWPQPPAGGEPWVHLQRWGGRRPCLSHLPTAAHQTPGHTLWTYLLPGVSHQLPSGEWLLPRVPHALNAADLQEAQPAGAQAAGQADCGLPLHWPLHWSTAPWWNGRPHQEQVG